MLRHDAFVSQQKPCDGGAAVLATILRHYHIPIGLSHVRAIMGVDPENPRFIKLIRAAEKFRFIVKICQGSYETLPLVPMPAIADVWTGDWMEHCVVLSEVRSHAVVVADPARGIRTVSRQEFVNHWTGFLLLIMPRPNVFPLFQASRRSTCRFLPKIGRPLFPEHLDVLSN